MKNEKIFIRLIRCKLFFSCIALVFLFSLISCTTSSSSKKGPKEGETFSKSMPNIIVTPEVAEYKKGVKILIAGSGFEPAQKVKLFINMGGVRSGIHFMVQPEPIPNELGAFASIWTPDREISNKLLEPLPTLYTLTVEDSNGMVLCTGFLAFCDPKAEKESPICSFAK
jgi:hypothetical protein